ncbi:thiol reductant ABC exporter subunit CydC [Planctomonas sp. JC2975]|uniref:thiol reductant ABC exporter subunit CydC n=1 Tax=Planctomonas sp. JC2975 TaxID=2729626 RepID=UPI001472A9B0|nr:thiol reductant ABC exporter subunit CydC [Planctomonas sp. JC2975]NNC10530.1 thiol reductant ABC exporter subunit CydC [Planctomonas sp. JC2975]
MTAARRPRGLEGIAEIGRRRILMLACLGALKALGLVLVADAIAFGIVTVIGHGDVTVAVLEGLAGAFIRAGAAWGLRVVSQAAASGVKQDLRSRLASSFRAREGGSVGADAQLASAGLDELDEYYTSYLPSLVGAATVPLLVGARNLAADWVSALIIVATVPLIPLFMALIGMHTRDRVAASLDALGRLSDHLVELARGLPVLVGLGRDREQTQALAEISDDHRRRSMTALRTAFLSALALDLLATISVALVAVVIGIRLLHGQLSLEAGLVALILAPECFAPLREIGAAFHASDAGREALRRVRTAIRRIPAGHHLVRHDTDGDTVAVRRLTVTYAGRTAPAVASVSFDAPAHGMTLLAGRSGAGKSTVLAVLAGRGPLLDDEARCTGSVTSPGVDAIAWMPQHPHFSSGTLLDEVSLYAAGRHGDDHRRNTSEGAAATGTDGADAMALLRRVGLGERALAHPASLSPGEARRLAFARMLAAVDAGARLVLLDEPTAHLDPDSAALLREEIATLRERTTVVVASHDARIHLLADHVEPISAEPRSSAASAPASAAPALPTTSAASAPPELDAGTPAGATKPTRGAGGAADPALDDPTRGGAPATGALSELFTVVHPVRLRMLAAIGVGVLSTCFAIALTAVSGWLIVRASQEPAIMYLLVAIVGVRFFGIGRSALRYAERLLTHDAVFRAVTALRVRVWQALAASGPAGRVALTPVNALSALIGSADRVRDLIPRVVQPPVAAGAVLVASAVALGLVYPPSLIVVACLAVAACIVAPVLAVTAGRIAAHRDEAARAAVLESFTDLLVAAQDLTPRAARRVIRRIESADAAAASSERRTALVEGAASAITVLACCAAAVAMLPLAAGAVASGALRPELVAVLVLVPLGMIEPLLDGVAAATRAPALARVLAGLHRVTSVLDDSTPSAHEAAGAATTALGDDERRTAPVHGIRLDAVSYRYPAALRPVFSGISGRADRGKWLAVTGPSGSGKSTLLALLLRFADPTAGRYLLRQGDGFTDAAAIPPHALRTRIAWCPQEGHLFDSTLRANLALARPRTDRPSDAELTDALTRVGLAPLLATLPQGLDTRIGAAGERLSGGQRQRVAVARTLLAGGDVVLIDEPTAQLDAQASAELMTDLRLALKDRVAVLVTHDAAEARGADQVIELGATSRHTPTRRTPTYHGRSDGAEPTHGIRIGAADTIVG